MRLHTFHLKARLAAASATAQLRRLLAVQTEGTVRQPLDLSELEDRILLSASPAAVMVDSAPAGESVEFATPLNSGGGTESLLESAASVTRLAESPQGEPDLQAAERAPELTATEVVFIDESAADFEQLVADLQSQRDAGRAVDIFVLDSQQDGVDQIAETLERYSDLDAVHIVSHGTDGAVKLGGTWLRIGSLDGYAGTIAGWGDAIGTDGDLLFYGCDLASNSRGEMLVESIAALTGADVAASTDDTGSSIRGGDWDLEYSAGSIETGVIFTDQLQAEWEGLLAVTPLTSTDEFRVNTTIGNVQETSNEDRGSTHAVAIAPNGEYVVVWSSNQITGSDGNGFGVLMQRFDATGNPISGELQVNQNTTFHQYHASVAVDDSGRGVVVWTDAENDADVQARLFHADGTFNGGEFLVNSTATSDQDNPSVAMDSSGNFVVVWEGSAPGDANGIHAQRFNAAGTKVGTEFTVNDTTTGTQSEPSVAMNSSGQFVVVWDDGGGVHARTYEADGTGGSGSQFNVDSTSSAG
ncbi:MAG: DUF4347 domain-containing protein [Planctomycetota bacterium]|nr:DUF4347 domain-containing protein [Planctomycetota bacterium]